MCGPDYSYSRETPEQVKARQIKDVQNNLAYHQAQVQSAQERLARLQSTGN